MYSQKELQEKIKRLDETIESGVQTVTVDATSTTVNLVELRTERDRLMKLYAAGRRPTTATIHLG